MNQSIRGLQAIIHAGVIAPIQCVGHRQDRGRTRLGSVRDDESEFESTGVAHLGGRVQHLCTRRIREYHSNLRVFSVTRIAGRSRCGDCHLLTHASAGGFHREFWRIARRRHGIRRGTGSDRTEQQCEGSTRTRDSSMPRPSRHRTGNSHLHSVVRDTRPVYR